MERGAAPAGRPRKPALGRLRASCRAALRPLCEVLAGRAGANAVSRKPGPELRRSESFDRNAAVERREARRSASLAGGPWRSRDRPDRKAGHRVRRSAPSACRRSTPLTREGRRIANASLPVFFVRRRVRLPSHDPRVSEGSGAPTGAGAERRTPWPDLAIGPSLQREGTAGP